MMQYEHEHGLGANGHNDATKPRKKTTGKVGRPPKDKTGAESKAHSNGNNHGADNSSPLATTTNGHLPTKKMEIHSMVNGDTEGEEMTSHDDEDARMEEGTEDDHEDDDEDEDDEAGHDEDEDAEAEDERMMLQQQVKNKASGTLYGHVEDVEMVDRHRAQDTPMAQGLVVSA
ncbi:MAG: hypothetical protein J3Q66DRAFT_354108 [Benniella sp.]|nr:MAG: hypothetical protein J3Q66DRAFT_354108 [Benniella sp.]